MRRLLFALLLCVAAVSAQAAGSALPSGYLSTNGNQIVSSTGASVRLACIGYNLPTASYSNDMSIIASAGFNCIRVPYYDKTLNLTTMDAIVSAATSANIRVIIDHHGNEANASCLNQQGNGLPYDKNSGNYSATNGTDGGCNGANAVTGTITEAQYKANWVTIATHYANNANVIGFDLHNEPISGGTGVSPTLGWGTANGSDLLAIYNDVGTAIAAVNSGALIIAEGPIQKATTLFSGSTTQVTLPMDLSLAGSKPVAIGPFTSDFSTSFGSGAGVVSNKIVYSVHDFPTGINSSTPDSGTTKVSAINAAWGYLVSGNIAPVWVGAMGASLDNTNGALTDETAWATTLTNYVNGLSSGSGGPSFTGSQQPISTGWWTFGYNAGQAPDGILNSDNSLKTGQKTYWTTLLFGSSGSSPSGASAAGTTWNTGDTSSTITFTNNNLTATTVGSLPPQSVRSTTSRSTGKLFFEITASTISNDFAVGIANASYPLDASSGCGGEANAICYYAVSPPQSVYVNGIPLIDGTVADVSGATLSIAVDLGANLFWATSPAMRAAGYTWNDSTTANPATGAGGLPMTGLNAGPYYIIFNEMEAGTAVLHPSAPFSVAVPSGFSPWDTTATITGAPITVILGANAMHIHE